MSAMERLRTERDFHDGQARSRAPAFAGRPDGLRFDDDAYLNHESWIRPALEELGEIRGKRVLDFGCGHGMAAVVLARRGGHVTAFDLSRGYLAEARQRADANSVTIDWLQIDGERLPFADASFDLVWGNAVLHHLDLVIAARELRRILRPGGRAVFCEPWGGNPLLRFARRRLPYPGKARTPEEEPFRRQDLRVVRRFFPNVSVRGFQLLGMSRRLFGHCRLTSELERCDRRLLTCMPILQDYCRYIVLCLRK
jgi:SAM-dependent methyltransferase